MKKRTLASLSILGLIATLTSPARAETSNTEMLAGGALLLPSYIGLTDGELLAKGHGRNYSGYYAPSRAEAARNLKRFHSSPKGRLLQAGAIAGGLLILDGLTGSHAWNAVTSSKESDRREKPSLGHELAEASIPSSSGSSSSSAR